VPQAVGTIPGSGQASHVLQVAGSVALDSWKLLLEVCADAVDDPGTPAFGLLADQDLAPDRDIIVGNNCSYIFGSIYLR
jgi:hypothetical protein